MTNVDYLVCKIKKLINMFVTASKNLPNYINYKIKFHHTFCSKIKHEDNTFGDYRWQENNIIKNINFLQLFYFIKFDWISTLRIYLIIFTPQTL